DPRSRVRRRRRREPGPHGQARHRAQQLARVRRVQLRHVPREALRAPGRLMDPRAVTGLGIVSNGATGGADAFFGAVKRGPAKVTAPRVELAEFDPTKYLGDKGLRTLDRLTKLLVVAARLCLHDAGLKKDNQWAGPSSGDRVGVCCSNAYGSLEAIHELD